MIHNIWFKNIYFQYFIDWLRNSIRNNHDETFASFFYNFYPIGLATLPITHERFSTVHERFPTGRKLYFRMGRIVYIIWDILNIFNFCNERKPKNWSKIKMLNFLRILNLFFSDLKIQKIGRVESFFKHVPKNPKFCPKWPDPKILIIVKGHNPMLFSMLNPKK